MNYLKSIIIFLSIFIVVSCNFRETARLKENLPKAKGRPGDILVVMDSAQWKGEVGSAIRGIFNQLVPGLPRNEPTFDLQYVDPLYFQSMFKLQRNIIFVTILNDKSPGNRKLKKYFTAASLKMIENNPELFMHNKKDDFAKDQEILHLFGNDPQHLIGNLKGHEIMLRKHFMDIDRGRLYRAIYNTNPIKGIQKHMEEKLQCSIKVPYGWEIGLENDQFIWIRNYSRDIDKNIFVAFLPYTHKEQFTLDSLINIRERIIRPNILYKPEDPESYMVTETYHMDVLREEVNFRKDYAVRLRGMWKLNKFTMGGPFVSYVMVDETLGRLYYIEGFLYSPGTEQRDIMRELDVILNTFRKSDQLGV